MNYLDFEKPLAEIEGKAEELRALARQNSEMDVEQEAAALDKKADDLLRDLYKSLTPWRKCQVARHPDRPHCSETTSTRFSRNSRRSPVTGTSPTITRSWAGSHGSTTRRWS
jgi:acetyl-CoA carboxylase carboxyl transferase subunit alpha